MSRLIILIYLFLNIQFYYCQNDSILLNNSSACFKNDYKMPLYSTRYLRLIFNQTRIRDLNLRTIRIYASIKDRKVADFGDQGYQTEKTYYLTNNTNIIYKLPIHANRINKTIVYYSIEIINNRNHIRQINCSIKLLVGSPQRLIDKIFKISIPMIIVATSIQMGMLLDILVLKELIRRPIQVLIGFVCQYLFMPLIALSITKIFRYQAIFGLGLFVIGCCPGGSQSNQWTVIFDGDLNLSAFMSFASTIASFFMMPLWLYTVAQYAYLRQLKVRVPFANLVTSLLTIVIPLAIGMFIVYIFPRVKKPMQRIIKPVLAILLFYFFIIGGLVHFYLFYYLDLRTALTAPFLPWCGFLLGSLFAWICKQDRRRIITIGLETGIQNIGIAMMVFYYSLPSPENSQASVIPIVVAYLSILPLLIIFIFQLIYRKYFKAKKKPIRHISVDTLSKTTRHLSEVEDEPLNDLSQTSQLPSESKPVQV